MDIATRIGKVGFRKWYERQLIDSHLSFTTCFLSGITVAACLEEVNLAEFGWKAMSLLAVVFGAAALGWYSWRRYITVLERAETYGGHSTCPACKTYGRFVIVASGHAAEGPYLDPAATPLPYPWLRVRCRKCDTVWRMPD
jgi:hypothetical protein